MKWYIDGETPGDVIPLVALIHPTFILMYSLDFMKVEKYVCNFKSQACSSSTSSSITVVSQIVQSFKNLSSS